MKCMHMHVSVRDLAESVHFYSKLFGAEPTILKDDYAKWKLEDPRVNFAITARGFKLGVDHLGIQVENVAELEEQSDRLAQAVGPKLDIGKTTCCYAEVEKSWVGDPQGVFWEVFLTHGQTTTYGSDPESLARLREETADALSSAAPAKSEGSCCP
jgi:catechol 2,3-dioxygenase-like lactoylglutathione lyase family enzyme